MECRMPTKLCDPSSPFRWPQSVSSRFKKTSLHAIACQPSRGRRTGDTPPRAGTWRQGFSHEALRCDRGDPANLQPAGNAGADAGAGQAWHRSAEVQQAADGVMNGCSRPVTCTVCSWLSLVCRQKIFARRASQGFRPCWNDGRSTPTIAFRWSFRAKDVC